MHLSEPNVLFLLCNIKSANYLRDEESEKELGEFTKLTLAIRRAGKYVVTYGTRRVKLRCSKRTTHFSGSSHTVLATARNFYLANRENEFLDGRKRTAK